MYISEHKIAIVNVTSIKPRLQTTVILPFITVLFPNNFTLKYYIESLIWTYSFHKPDVPIRMYICKWKFIFKVHK